jgi:hypothetical protein
MEASAHRESDASARVELEARARQAEAAARQAEATVPEDERSVPPVGDLSTEFFSSRPPSWLPQRGAVEEDPFGLPAHDKLARSLAPQAVARRARFARYVRGAVGVSALLCVAAVVKSALTRDDSTPPRRSAASEAPPSSDHLAPPAAAQAYDPPAESLAQAAQGVGALDAGDGGAPAMAPAARPAGDPGAPGTLRVR